MYYMKPQYNLYLCYIVTTLGFEMGSRTVNESAGTIQDALCLAINGGVSCSVFSGIIVTFTVSGSGNYGNTV